MTVNEFVEAATALGWTVIDKQALYVRFPFCRDAAVNAIRLQSHSSSGHMRPHSLYEPHPSVTYNKRFLTEMRKHNEKVFARLPEAKDCKGLIDVMRYCT